ncbi:MAG: type IV secretion system DNA-binding domain-containing protein [Candidatus Paceibacterota bacterium]|jgi:hypothetical protein
MSYFEFLTKQFYTWEKRGRGWEVFSFPVDLEPPYEPFFSHSIPYDNATRVLDDGLRPTIFSRLITGVRNLFISKPIISEEIVEDEPVPPFTFDDEPLTAFTVLLPKDQQINFEESLQLLLMLSMSMYPISFEIIGNSSFIKIQFVCRKPDTPNIQNQIKAYFPACHFDFGILEAILPEGKQGYLVDFGLSQEFMRPLSVIKNFTLDPYIGLFGILENLSEDEQAVIQILFKSAQNSWSESIIRSVTDNQGDPFFLDAPEMVKLAEEKISAPLFGVVIRIIGLNEDGSDWLAKKLSGKLIQITGSPYNRLIPLSTEGYDEANFCEDILLRQSHRLGMLLNSKELVSLIHFPSISVVSSKLERAIRKTVKAPKIFLDHKLVLGSNFHQGQAKDVTIGPEQRLKHIHVIGATGTGKSTLLLNMIIQDIRNGEGLAVIDPHGDLIESILPWIPPIRHNDVIIFDPSDTEYPIAFNILTAHSEIEKDILSSDLVAVFKRLSTSWGDQMNSVFANAILAFLESDKGGTLIDLRKFLIEKEFRADFLKTVKDPSITYYWNKEFPILKSTSIGPILTRLDAFLRPKVIRNMVAQNKSLDFEKILDDKKILLIKLSQGLIGEENSYLLGAFIVSKLQQITMSRQVKAKTARGNFYLYIDEFQNFITPSMSAILSGARKYHLGMVLAHQGMQQLDKNNSEIASSVIANAGTRICFRIGDIDAKKLEANFTHFDA